MSQLAVPGAQPLPQTLQNISELLLYDDSTGRFSYGESLETMVNACHALCTLGGGMPKTLLQMSWYAMSRTENGVLAKHRGSLHEMLSKTPSRVGHPVWVNICILLFNLCKRAAELCSKDGPVVYQVTTTSDGVEIPRFKWNLLWIDRVFGSHELEVYFDGNEISACQVNNMAVCEFVASNVTGSRADNVGTLEIRDAIRDRLNALRPTLVVGGIPLEKVVQNKFNIHPDNSDETKLAIAAILGIFENLRCASSAGAAHQAQRSFVDQ